ncbi:hypothetical protein AB1K54_11830 [Microbacterium sp. BWT-B31]|uniref:hypothetical protein n=1 Tax=Microbacterium sp. BWT-B31 TaxID=3232072 RepID=UPI0035298DBF
MPHPLTSSFRVETLRSGEQFRAAAALYTRVFGYDRPEFSLNPNLLSALARNGGSAVGVFTSQDDLIGFAYGFIGRDANGDEFHYSQAAVVDAAHQGEGVGRLIKEHQRRVALGWGHRTMRWTFDPILARNAHFNFTSLGAEGIGFVPDYYDRPGTDRVVVEWALDRETDPYEDLRRVAPPLLGPTDWGRVTRGTVAAADGTVRRAAWLAVPSTRPGSPVDPAGRTDVAALRARLRDSLTMFVTERSVLVACTRINATTAAYLAVERLGGEQAR